MSLMLEPLRKFAVFEGRARRSEYWLFALFQVLVLVGYFVFSAIVYAATGGPASGGHWEGPGASLVGGLAVLLILFSIALIVPGLAVSVRRLHDSDKSGWLLLLCFVPFGGIAVLIFTLIDGTPGPNRYGDDPKGRAGPPGSGPVVHNHYYGAQPAADQPTIVS